MVKQEGRSDDSSKPATETTPLIPDNGVKPNEWSRGLKLERSFSSFFQRYIPGYGANASLEQSWDYFEQYILPRRVVSNDGSHKRAVPGLTTEPTELYPAWTTPQKSLSEFGTGIAVYFHTMRFVFWVFVGAFVLYLPSILYYASRRYDPDAARYPWDFFRDGSLMCKHTEWVPCVGCEAARFPGDRIAYSEDASLLFVLKNACAPMRWQEGLNHLVVIVYLVVCFVYMGFYQTKLELEYDEDVLTARDYSVTVLNPPSDALNVNEWKEFFSQFGQVVYCTVSLNNEELVRALVRRRTVLMDALFQTKQTEAYNDRTKPVHTVPSDVRTSNPSLATKCDAADENCRRVLNSASYNATRIFITFETEEAQRKALSALSVAKLAVATNNINRLPPEHVFRGSKVLDVAESMEPSTVRWRDLNVSDLRRMLQKAGARILTLILIGFAMWSVAYAFKISTNVAAILIAGYSSMASSLFAIVNMLESHEGETSYQASLFAKIVAFRFFNSVLATTLIKPFTYTAGVSSTALIPAIYAVLLAEILVTPLSYLCDPVGQLNRHIMAPFAKNQVAMNSYFRGSKENLGDKYTNMVKIIFLCFFYSVIFPSGFFLGALSIAGLYYSDKFLLVRRWAPMPELGDDITRFSRRFVIPFCLVSLIMISEFYWSAFPYDNVCDTDTTAASKASGIYDIVGEHSLKIFASPSKETIVNVQEGDTLYRFCDQYYLAHLSGLLRVFEIETDDWMSVDQQWLTYLFGLVCVVVWAMLCLVAIKSDAIPLLQTVLAGGFETNEKDSGLLYTQQGNIKAYIPHVPHPYLPFSLLTCDMTQVDEAHIGWEDPIRGHEYYYMTKDVEYLLDGKQLERPVLSVIGHWKQ